MKPLIVLLLVLGTFNLHAQFLGSSSMVKVSSGYTHDFPGLNGYTVAGEYSFELTSILQGSMGMKHADMQGFPSSNQAFEFTRASTIDFNLYYAPLRTEAQLFRFGLGYSFSIYNIQRAFPLQVTNEYGKSSYTWPTQQTKGRTTGINVIAEYEHKIPNTRFSMGVRGALYKAYAETKYAGVVIGYAL